MAVTATTNNGYQNGLSNELMRVSGDRSQATYTAKCFSDKVSDVIRIDFKDSFHGNFRTAYDPTRTSLDTSLDGQRGFREEARISLAVNSQTNYDIAKHFRVKQINGDTGEVVAEGIALRWVPPSSSGGGGSLFIKVLFHASEDPTSFNIANGVIYCDEIDEFTYNSKTFPANPMYYGSSIRSVQTVSNVYKLTTVEALNSGSNSETCDSSTITTGKGLYESGQRVHLKRLPTHPICDSTFLATGVVISSAVDAATQKVSVFVEFDSPLNDTAGQEGNCSDCSDTNTLILCTGNSNGDCTSSCCIYQIDAVRKISTPECGTVQKIIFSDEVVANGEFVPGRELYQWKYELCGNHPANGDYRVYKQDNSVSKISGEYLNWDSGSKTLYVLCPGSIMKIEYGNVYQKLATGVLLSRGTGIASTSKFDRKTGSFINLRNTSENPSYVPGFEYTQSWETETGGEKLVQTISTGDTSYNPNYEYAIGETVIQALTESSDGTITNYAAGTVVDWQPNSTALNNVPSILTVKRIKLGTDDPLNINTNNPLILTNKTLSRFRYGPGISPSSTGTKLKNSKRNILPLRVFEDVTTSGSTVTNWYNFSSNAVVQNSLPSGATDSITESIGTIAQGSSIGTTRIKAIQLDAGNVYNVSLMNTNIAYNEPISFSDVTQIGKSVVNTTALGVSYNSIVSLVNINQEVIDGENITKLYFPTSDKQIISLPGSDVIENVITGSANFGSTEITVQKLYNVNFTSNSVEVKVNDQYNSIENAEFPSYFASTFSFAVDQSGNTVNLVKYNNLESSNAEPADNSTLYYDVFSEGSENSSRDTILFRKKTNGTITSILFGAEVKCVVSSVLKTKTQKQFDQTAYLRYQTSGKFKGKWTAQLEEYDVSSLISVFFVSSPLGAQIQSENKKALFGISREVDDYAYGKSILVLSSDGVVENQNTDISQGAVTPNIPKFGTLVREGVTENYSVQISVSGFSSSIPTNTAGIIMRESYKDFNTNTLSVKNIPYYKSKVDGNEYHLSAILDCRGLLNDSGTYGQTKFVILPQSSTVNTSLGVYMPRYDLLYINKEGTFKFAYGITSLTPQYPDLPEDGMVLYKIQKPSYIFTNQDLSFIYTDNKRYTMRDIGRIDKRVQQLEVYSSLSLLEKDADSLLIEDTNGNNRFKNGIIVDPFENHKIGEVSHPDYYIAIDETETCLRPKAKVENLKITPVSDSSTFIEIKNSKTGVIGSTANPSISTGLFMMPYTETAFVVQPQATRSMTLTPFETLNLEGTVRLAPREDDWVDTTTRPDLNVNLAGENDIWEGILDELNSSPDGPFSLEFGNWTELSRQSTSRTRRTTTAQGRRRTRTTTTTTNTRIREQRSIIGEQLRTTTEQVSLGDRVVDVSLIPYMRAKRLKIVINGMKTNSRIYPFFDGIDVSQYCYLYSSIAQMDTDFANLTLNEANKFTNTTSGFKKTDSSGNAFIIFEMPGGVFRTGDRKFTISDNQNNDFSRASTFATGTYSASGLSQIRETTRATIRNFDTETINRTEERILSQSTVNTNTTTWRVDPLAQTFTINPELYPNGIFLSSIDVFFARKPDNSTNIPAKIEVRPTVNGFPDANKIYPGGICILHPSQVNVSDAPSANNSATATRFTFEHPLYLEPGEHSFVVRSTSDEYEIYIAEIGQTLLNTTQRVTEQPYVGVFFSSSNASTWLPQPAVDMMMTLNKCEFTTNQLYTFVGKTNFAGKDLNYEILNLSNSYQEFDVAKISWQISENNTLDGTYTNINANQDIKYTSTKILRDGNSLFFKATGLTTSKDVCPVINTERLSGFVIKNTIENNNNSTSNGELNPYASDIGEMRRARYITKIVTLEDGFESTGFKLVLSVNKPVGTRIQAFLKYQTTEQTKEFHDNNYIELIPDMGIDQFNAFYTRNETDYVDVSFRLPVDTSVPYNKFAIKLCLYSENAAYVPKIQDLRGIAVL